MAISVAYAVGTCIACPMKIRIYFPFFPFPVTEGAYMVVADQVRHFAARGHAVELVVWRETRASIEEKLARSAWPSSARWVLLGGGRKERRISRLGRVVRAVCTGQASPELFHYPPGMLEHVGQLGLADLAIYHYSYAYSWLGQPRRLPTEGRRVVHFHNIESDLHRLRGGIFSAFHCANAWKLKDHEKRVTKLVDEAWFLSEVDAQDLKLPNSRVVPPTVDVSVRPRRNRVPAGGVSAGFIGGMQFMPNRESASWILSELAPRLAVGGFRGKLVFVGKAMPTSLRRIGSRFPFVEFRGFAADLDSFWGELSFLLAPQVVGSGVRTKIYESVAYGVPVLTNAAGAAPLPAALRNSRLIISRNDPNDWARVLLAEATAQETRARLEGEPISRAITSDEVYGHVA